MKGLRFPNLYLGQSLYAPVRGSPTFIGLLDTGVQMTVILGSCRSRIKRVALGGLEEGAIAYGRRVQMFLDLKMLMTVVPVHGTQKVLTLAVGNTEHHQYFTGICTTKEDKLSIMDQLHF